MGLTVESTADREVKIGSVSLDSPYALAPMAGMTDTAFRRLVKRRGGCGLVVTEMVSSEGLVRGIDRTLEYAEYTEEERPVSIQIFGGDPVTMAEAAKIVEGMGADIIDVNMGCPVRKIAKHQAGCSLMRTPEHAATVVSAMTGAVSIPVTVKMRAGWDDDHVNAPTMADLMEQSGAAGVAVHGRTAKQSYKGRSDWSLIDEVARRVTIPVFGSGDCVAPEEADYRHNDFNTRTVHMHEDECPNGHSHCRQLVLGTSESVPLIQGKMSLGQWQRIFFVELDKDRAGLIDGRQVVVQVIGQS